MIYDLLMTKQTYTTVLPVSSLNANKFFMLNFNYLPDDGDSIVS